MRCHAYENPCYLIKQPWTHTVKQKSVEKTRSKFYFVEKQ